MKLILFFLGFISLQAAVGQTQIDLDGIWYIDFNTSLNLMNENKRKEFGKLPERAKKDIELLFSEREFHFEADVITIKWNTPNGEREVSGTWKKTNDGISITTDKKTKEYSIEKRSDSLLILVQKNDGGGLFQQLALKK